MSDARPTMIITKEIDPRTDPNRPRFILEPWDPHAALLARIWAMIREDYVRLGLKPASDLMSAEEARQQAYRMERWFREHEVTGRLSNDPPERG